MIHQPSISILELEFDGLLLLQKGGYMAYFQSLVKILEYFEFIPRTELQYHLVTYMLEVIGAGIGPGRFVRDVKDYSVEYKNSELYKSNRDRTLQLAKVSNDFVRHSKLNYRSRILEPAPGVRLYAEDGQDLYRDF